jgi:hypothetical protein
MRRRTDLINEDFHSDAVADATKLNMITRIVERQLSTAENYETYEQRRLAEQMAQIIQAEEAGIQS